MKIAIGILAGGMAFALWRSVYRGHERIGLAGGPAAVVVVIASGIIDAWGAWETWMMITLCVLAFWLGIARCAK